MISKLIFRSLMMSSILLLNGCTVLYAVYITADTELDSNKRKHSKLCKTINQSYITKEGKINIKNEKSIYIFDNRNDLTFYLPEFSRSDKWTFIEGYISKDKNAGFYKVTKMTVAECEKLKENITNVYQSSNSIKSYEENYCLSFKRINKIQSNLRYKVVHSYIEEDINKSAIGLVKTTLKLNGKTIEDIEVANYSGKNYGYGTMTSSCPNEETLYNKKFSLWWNK